jgi:hypothetical protein
MWRSPTGKLLSDWRDALFDAAKDNETTTQCLLHMCAEEIKAVLVHRLMRLCGMPNEARALLIAVGYTESRSAEEKKATVGCQAPVAEARPEAPAGRRKRPRHKGGK